MGNVIWDMGHGVYLALAMGTKTSAPRTRPCQMHLCQAMRAASNTSKSLAKEIATVIDWLACR